MWLYTADGRLCRYWNGQGNVTGLGTNYFSNCRIVAAEKNGPLWVGTDYELVSLDVSELPKPTEMPPFLENPLPTKVDYLLAGRDGGCWRLAGGRVQFWRVNDMERDFGPYPWSESTRVGAACEDDNGNLIVGTLGEGVFWYDKDGNYRHLSKADGLSSDWALSLCLDREGDLWVGTDGGGLDRVKQTVFRIVPLTRDLVVQSVCQDEQGGLWMGLNGGVSGIGVIYQKGDVTKRFGANEGLLNQNVWSVFVDSKQRVWAGTWQGLYLFQPQSGIFTPVLGPDASVLAIHQDRIGRLWFGTQNGLVCFEEPELKNYTTRDGLSSDVVRAIEDDADGNIWIGTMGGGLNRLSGGRFISYRKSEDGLPSDDIASLLVDDEGALWVGTFGSGLARFYQGKWTRYSTRNGLFSNAVGYLIEDEEDSFWIGSSAGLMRASKKALDDVAAGASDSLPCRLYGRADGLSECTQGSQPGAERGQDGTLRFPTTSGLVIVNPEELRPNSNPPPVVIESVLVGGQPQTTNSLWTAPPAQVIVPPRKEQLEIHFTSLNLAAARRARFSYNLENYEAAPIDSGGSRVVRYPKLPPGEYVFRVTARNEDGVESETPATLAITVLPAFWQTGSFRTVVIGGLLILIVAVVYFMSTQKLHREVEQLRQKEAVEKDRARIARDLHDQLGASLTQVALLGELVESDKDAPSEVETHGRQISQTARETTHVLDEIVWAVNPSNDTLDSLITYVCKQAQDYLAVAGVRLRLDVPIQLPAVPVAPEVRHNVFLGVKEAVTNVVRHAHASEVWIRMRLEDGQFSLEIQDNGRGVDLSKPQTRNGLRNMRRRMEDVGGGFSIGLADGGGTIVKLTSPTKIR